MTPARGLLVAVALLLCTPVSALAAPPTPSPSTETPTRTIVVVINGQQLQTGQDPRVIDGRVMLPLRVVFDALGVPVTKQGTSITGQLPTGKIFVTVGSADALVNGRPVRLDAPAKDIDGTMYVPLRFVGDALGATTTYDGRGARVEIVSPLIGRNAGDEAAPGGGTRVRGVITEIDRNVEPPTVTVNIRGSARTISVNSDAKIFIEDVTINSQLKGTLADMRVGDALLAILARDGKVVELDDFFRSSSGTVAAVSPTAVVLGSGAVVTPSATTSLTLNGTAAKVSDLLVGDYVTVRRNPESGELREVIASRKAAPGTAAPASAVKITSFSTTAARALRAGEYLDVTLQGTPGGRATFDIGNVVLDIAMHEDAPGTYRARFTIPERFNVTNVPLYGHLSAGGSDAPRAEASAPFTASTTAPSIIDVAPPAGQTVNTSRPNIYATFVSPNEVAINQSSIQLVVNGRDVTASATRSGTFITYTPGLDYPDGSVTVIVRVADEAGNTTSRTWTFTIRTR
jgi:copper amine oxidase-like protein